MKIAVTGHRGNLGRRLVALGAIPLTCDITDTFSVASEIDRVQPDLIIHAAAKSNVDECEKDQEETFKVNVWGTNVICEYAHNANTQVLFLSSEQVFNGRWGKYKETSKPDPINAYGLSKLAAEGVASLYGFKTLRLSRGVQENDGDFYGSTIREAPASTFFYRNYQHLDFLAEQVKWCANQYENIPSTLHIGGADYLSFYELVSRINPKVQKRKKYNKDMVSRPKKAGFNLSLAKKIGVPMYSIEETIERFFRE